MVECWPGMSGAGFHPQLCQKTRQNKNKRSLVSLCAMKSHLYSGPFSMSSVALSLVTSDKSVLGLFLRYIHHHKHTCIFSVVHWGGGEKGRISFSFYGARAGAQAPPRPGKRCTPDPHPQPAPAVLSQAFTSVLIQLPVVPVWCTGELAAHLALSAVCQGRLGPGSLPAVLSPLRCFGLAGMSGAVVCVVRYHDLFTVLSKSSSQMQIYVTVMV